MPPQRTTGGTKGAKEGQAKPAAAYAESDQRRARNRLAQMASRERKTAQIQRLEHQLALARRHDGDAKVQALMEENANLRQSFLTVRKKLLSLSTTASLLADSLIPFVNGEQSSTCKLHEESTSPSNQNEESPPAESNVEGDPFLASYGGGSQCEPILDLADAYPLLEALQDHTAFVPIENGVPLPSDLTSTGPVGRSDARESLEARARLKTSAETIGIPNNLFQQLQSPWNMMPSLSCVSVRQRSKMSRHLDYIQHIMRSNGWANSSSAYPPKVLDVLLQEYLKQCWPMMIPWFHVTRTAEVIRSVLWWQVTNSVNAANQLSSIHAPTFIQLSTPHPSILDWIPHATLRDMLILNQESFALDVVIADLAAAYVFESESDGCPGGARETKNLMDAVHNSLRSGMPLLGSAESQTRNGQHVSMAEGGASLRTIPKQTAAEIHQFRIDSSFFIKYPALYDPAAVGKGTANPPVTFGNVPTPLPFTNDAAQAYMRTATSFLTV